MEASCKASEQQKLARLRLIQGGKRANLDRYFAYPTRMRERRFLQNTYLGFQSLNRSTRVAVETASSNAET